MGSRQLLKLLCNIYSVSLMSIHEALCRRSSTTQTSKFHESLFIQKCTFKQDISLALDFYGRYTEHFVQNKKIRKKAKKSFSSEQIILLRHMLLKTFTPKHDFHSKF